MVMLQRKVSNDISYEDDSLFQVRSDDSTESDLENFEIGLRAIPFSKLIEQYLPFDDPALKRLVPHCGLRLSIQDIYFKDSRHWYVIDIEHARFKWSVKKRSRELFQLHRQLQIYRTLLSIQLPEIKFEKDPSNHRRPTLIIQQAEVPKLPKFPLTADVLSRNKEANWNWKMATVETYLQNILNTPKFRNFRDTLEFLEIGPLSFIDELGPKSKEGFVYRRWDRHSSFGLGTRLCFCRCCPSWKKRWLFIKESFVGLLNPSTGQVECILLLDRGFKVNVGKDKTSDSRSLLIQNLNRNLHLKCDNRYQVESWALEFSYFLDTCMKDFISPNKYESFAPPRPLTECRWIVDGATYFEAVAEVLDKAKEEIYIADWWLSPEIYLKRPTVHGHYWQLDNVLKRKARSGVRIYVLLYKELEFALGINSYHSQKKLVKMHKNIKVLRHPYVSKGVLLWAHHEKIVCVDQTYAFVGGLDLCYGRWDDYQHRLCDFGENEEDLKIMRHMSRVGPKITTKIKSVNSVPDLSSISNLPPVVVRKPVTEPKIVSKRNKFKAAVKKHQAFKIFSDIRRRLSKEAQSVDLLTDLRLGPADRRRTVQEVALMVLGMDRKYRLWHGKDYVNFINKDFENLHQPYSDMIDRTVTPRMPWHDVGLFVQGKIARDIARHFILRWNHAKSEICPSDASHPDLIPRTYSDFGDTVPSFLQDTVGTIFRAECQVLRSLSYWSGHVCETEMSIHNAYIDVILQSKHFIYIENQFFITQPSGDRNVFNGIAEALFNRILKAHREKTPFHVFVLLPLLPAFEGEVGTGTGVCIQAITHWNYKSICRGPSSLLGRLSTHVKDPSMYISFYGLRTHGTLNNKLVTELVYVHSKMIIADDQVAIIGSANINDRSMLGRRDSEIAVLIRDTHFLEQEEGRPHEAGKFCYSLRTSLFREHLGLMTDSDSSEDLKDPSNERFFKTTWAPIATTNTKIYDEVFRCLPTDRVRNYNQLKAYQAESCLGTTNPDLAKRKLKAIRGYLVAFPLNFLCEESLEPTISTKEHYLPNSVWT